MLIFEREKEIPLFNFNFVVEKFTAVRYNKYKGNSRKLFGKLEFDEECECMKKLIALLLATVLLLSLVACGGKTIGEVRGAENEYITIDDVKYVLDTDNDFTQADKGTYLGKVSNSKITMKVYSVKGDTKEEYIYALWDWEGAFYKKEQ